MEHYVRDWEGSSLRGTKLNAIHEGIHSLFWERVPIVAESLVLLEQKRVWTSFMPYPLNKGEEKGASKSKSPDAKRVGCWCTDCSCCQRFYEVCRSVFVAGFTIVMHHYCDASQETADHLELIQSLHLSLANWAMLTCSSSSLNLPFLKKKKERIFTSHFIMWIKQDQL